MDKQNPIRLAILESVASEKDAESGSQLWVHLSTHVRTDLAIVWSYRQIEPGACRYESTRAQLARADLLLLLVSPDFLAYELGDTQLRNLIQEYGRSIRTGVIVILRPCVWLCDPLLIELVTPMTNRAPFVVFPADGALLTKPLSLDTFYQFLSVVVQFSHSWRIANLSASKNIAASLPVSADHSKELRLTSVEKIQSSPMGDVVFPTQQQTPPCRTATSTNGNVLPSRGKGDHFARRRRWAATFSSLALAAAFAVSLGSWLTPQSISSTNISWRIDVPYAQDGRILI